MRVGFWGPKWNLRLRKVKDHLRKLCFRYNIHRVTFDLGTVTRCIIHLSVDDKDEDTKFSIIPLTEESLKKCQDAALGRSDSTSKYSAIQLPSCVEDGMGYHAKCYRNFTAVSSVKVQKKKKEIMDETSITGTTGNAVAGCKSY